jgi:purine-binding chemotaxis protein CheW
VSLHVRMRAGAEHYALPVSSVTEVAKLGEFSVLPGAPAGVLGLCNLHGCVLPVLDLGALLGITSDEPLSRVVVAEDSGRQAALVVDAVVGVEEITDTSEAVQSRQLSSAALIDGTLVGIIDLPALLDSVQGGVPR